MHLKRYQRQTVQEALRAVREELGPDALVLSTRLVAASGPRGWFGRRVVEVTAAADRPAVPEVRQAAAAITAREQGQPPAMRFASSDARTNAGSSGTSQPTSAMADQRSREIAARLEATGLDADVAREVAEAHPRDRRRGVSIRVMCSTLAEQLSPLVAHDDGYAPIEVFVGPPGVGKTTTIAKIAAQERARYGNRLGLIAADGFRVGAVEQLRLYANILGSPISIARTPYELQTAIEAATSPVLLDTAGRSPSDEASRDMLRVVASRPDVRTHLVIAADTPVSTMRKILERFECVRPARLVLTKLDEAESLAPIVSLLRERQLPISYLGVGQRVPDDLQAATARALASWIAGDYGVRGAVA